MRPGAAVAGLLATAALVGGGWWAWQGEGARSEASAELRIARAEMRSIASTVLATGIVRLRVGAEVRVGSQLSGIVEELNVTVGSSIQQGDLIARIDSRNLEARLAQANAQVRVLEQEVRRAERELERARQLDQDKLVARSDVEDRSLDLADAEARLEKARRDAAVVRTELAYAEIRAPISGTIASVATQEGETVAASFTTPTFVTIIDTSALELIALVDETDIGAVAVNNPVNFTVEAHPAEEFTGRVTQVAPKGSIISGVVNYEVMIEIASPTELLKPDMTANVAIRTAEREVLVVPSEAVQREGFDRYVYLDTPDGYRRRSVNVGTQDGAWVEIRQGLVAGDAVAIGQVGPLTAGA